MAYKNKRHMYITAEQKEALVVFMDGQPQLRSGKFTNEFTTKRAQQLWQAIAKKLNAMGGSTKDWKHWRKTWQDIKTKKKSKQGAIAVHATTNGDKSLLGSELDPEDEIHPTHIVGDMIVAESEVDCEFLKEVTTETEQAASELLTVTPSTSGAKTTPSRARNFKKSICSAQNILEQTLRAMAKSTNQDNKLLALKREYYKQKILLMEEDVIEKERIATALEKIADSLCYNAKLIH